MYKKSLAIALFLLAIASVGYASPVVACSTLNGDSYTTVVAAQATAGLPTCYDQDLLFYFSALTGSGLGSVSLSNLSNSITVSFVTPSGVPTFGGQTSPGINLSPGNAAGTIATWTNAALGGGANPNFTFAINAAICTAVTCPVVQAGDIIGSVNYQQQSTVPDPSNSSISLTSSGGTQALTTNAGAVGTETTQSSQLNSLFANTTSDTLFVPAGQFGVTSYGYVYSETLPGAPEPTTMFLMGGALIGLGLVNRKRRKS